MNREPIANRLYRWNQYRNQMRGKAPFTLEHLAEEIRKLGDIPFIMTIPIGGGKDGK